MSTNRQFDNLFRETPGYAGTFYQQEAPVLKPGQFAVINTDDNIPAPPYGIHWVALYNKHGVHWYFDSFGKPPVKYLPRAAKYNRRKLQADESDKCGEWVACWLLYVQGVTGSFEQAMKNFIRMFPNDAAIPRQ